MNCQKVSHLLSAFMDSELPGYEHRQVLVHLRDCSSCRCSYEGLLQLKRLLSNLRTKEPGQRLVNNILAQLEDQRDRDSFGWLRRSFLSFQRMTLSPSTALSVGIGVSLIAFFSFTQTSAKETTTRPEKSPFQLGNGTMQRLTNQSDLFIQNPPKTVTTNSVPRQFIILRRYNLQQPINSSSFTNQPVFFIIPKSAVPMGNNTLPLPAQFKQAEPKLPSAQNPISYYLIPVR